MGRWGGETRSSSSRINRTPDLKRPGAGPLHAGATILVGALLAAEVARLTLALAWAESRPLLARSLAPNSPDVLMSTAMAKVGADAVQGRTPDAQTMSLFGELSKAAPLHSQPFLVQAALAEKDGNDALAEQLLLEARRRDPRSVGARYLLADVWLRQGKILDGLGEMASLSRLVSGSAVQLVPALAQYAQSPGAPQNLRRILASNPRLKDPLLGALAADPKNAGLILYLQGPASESGKGQVPTWQPRLLNAFIQQGAYQDAYRLWRRLAGLPEGVPVPIFNPGFEPNPAPPPFNWTFTSSGAGFTEAGDGMRVLYYGRTDASLASQLLLLPPGTYRLASPVNGTVTAGTLAWVLTCLPQSKPIMSLDLTNSASPVIFQVPANCPAQKLELVGQAQDMPEQSDVRVGPLAIERSGS